MATATPALEKPPRWSVVVPYYNERDFIPDTVRSLLAQTMRPLRLILVDNASTDGSRACIDAAAAEPPPGVTITHVLERQPGQVHALAAGIAAVDSEFVAICDADTLYPPQYLARAERLFERGGADVAAVLAFGSPAPHSWAGRLTRAKGALMAALLAKQCHAGGYGHAFRTEVLRRAGGYSKALWPHVLKDHELMHRVLKQGRAVYAYGHWCQSSDRRADRRGVRWTLPERLLYHATPFAMKDWFFYEFLARRFAQRKLDDLTLRAQPWLQAQAGASPASSGATETGARSGSPE